MSLGRSLIDDRKRITLVGEVSDILGVKPGDYVCYEQHDDGSICLRGYGLRKKPSNQGGGDASNKKTTA